MDKNNQQKLWAIIKDYRLIMCSTLEEKLQTGLICKSCIKEFFDGNNHNANTCPNIDDFGLYVSSTFAHVVQVTCHRGKHSFLVEPPQRKIKDDKESDKDNTNAKKKWGIQ